MNQISRGTYELDAEQVKLNAYRLGCLFFANKEIARRSDPASPSAAAQLEQQFFAREMSHLLLQIAIALRVMDDQMRARPETDGKRSEYLRRRDETDRRFECMMFDAMPLREVCNKIIHALAVEPHLTDAMIPITWMIWRMNTRAPKTRSTVARSSGTLSNGAISLGTFGWSGRRVKRLGTTF